MCLLSISVWIIHSVGILFSFRHYNIACKDLLTFYLFFLLLSQTWYHPVFVIYMGEQGEKKKEKKKQPLFWFNQHVGKFEFDSYWQTPRFIVCTNFWYFNQELFSREMNDTPEENLIEGWRYSPGDLDERVSQRWGEVILWTVAV